MPASLSPAVRFDFFGIGRLAFGRGQFARLGEWAAGFGKSAIVIHNAGASGMETLRRAGEMLSAADVSAEFMRQEGEPTVEDVDRAADHARGRGCEVVIGLGGGSAIDAAKAVAGLLGNGGSALDYMEVVGRGRKLSEPAAPWIAVPTTAGTGAEATRNAVIGAPDRHFKASIRSELLLPRLALIDPELGVAVRPEVTGRGGMDALCQCIEAYTSTGAQPITGALALRGVALAGRSLRRAYENGADLDAREDMALAALFSGIALTNAGLGAVHGFAAPLGANFPIPHGTICAALLPHVITANVATLRQRPDGQGILSRYAEVGRALAGGGDLSEENAIEACARLTTELVRSLRIPSLGACGLDERRVPEMVELARKASSMRYNPVELSDEMLADVLRAATSERESKRILNHNSESG